MTNAEAILTLSVDAKNPCCHCGFDCKQPPPSFLLKQCKVNTLDLPVNNVEDKYACRFCEFAFICRHYAEPEEMEEPKEE